MRPTTCLLFSGFFLLLQLAARSQELFPLNEPASTIPKNVLGIRIGTHVHYKYSQPGHREYVKLMYGLSPTISLIATVTSSNFHLSEFPSDLNLYYNNFHNHRSTEIKYPYDVEGVHLFTKWRFLSLDHKNEHLRIALYNELSFSKALHMDAFPVLAGDNSGMALGLIVTKLKKKFACSFSGGFNKYFHNKRSRPDAIEFQAGNAVNMNLSLGYLLFPKRYDSYKDVNFNIYTEFHSRFFERPVISRNGTVINSEQFPYLRKGHFIYAYPGVQLIFNSRMRWDVGVELPLRTQAGLGKFAMLMIGVQRYFY